MLQYSSFSLLFMAKLNYYPQISNKFARKLRRSYRCLSSDDKTGT
ncbi:hypothetical protein HMPREF9442_00448 [Paraprevotella xylaniphila YIT 11841]|uniref:Uncharacterized protein n=1 Tax=Paraprevotella xylaniphila YIT 11841 TaxID=762982 RepID=F3QQK6_9BACT|nr:hypothetical protein HMPREF9442_00448 [Paraprevotella xylaniphila YIT 11841]